MVNIQNKFEIGKYEVTIGEYKACVSVGWCKQPEWSEKDNEYNILTGSKDMYKRMCLEDNCPIMGVSWYDAKAYTKWLSYKTGKSYRLPTEKEWEYVAKAGKSLDWKWSFGNDENELRKYAWYRKNSFDVGEKHKDFGIHPVGEKLPNPWGIYDIYGNVWEWCEDWYDTDKDTKVLRGGSWFFHFYYSGSSRRYRYIPSDKDVNWGFRILRTLS